MCYSCLDSFSQVTYTLRCWRIQGGMENKINDNAIWDTQSTTTYQSLALKIWKPNSSGLVSLLALMWDCFDTHGILLASLPRQAMLLLNHFSCVWLCVAVGTVAHQTPLSVRFSRQEYWSGLPCSPPWALPIPGIKPMSSMSPASAGGFFTTSTTWEAQTSNGGSESESWFPKTIKVCSPDISANDWTTLNPLWVLSHKMLVFLAYGLPISGQMSGWDYNGIWTKDTRTFNSVFSQSKREIYE